MYNKNKRGPKMDPCGTPNLIEIYDEKVWFKAVNWDLDLKYEVYKDKTGPLNPYLNSLRSRTSWLTESKAFARSRNIEQVFNLLSKLLSNFSHMSMMAYSVP